MKKIGYRDETDQEYAKALKKVKTLDDLQVLMFEYEDLVKDAMKLVNEMDKQDFKKFIKNRNKESRGIFSNDKTTSIIMMPEKMMKVAMVAIQCKVPFGAAYIRMEGLK